MFVFALTTFLRAVLTARPVASATAIQLSLTEVTEVAQPFTCTTSSFHEVCRASQPRLRTGFLHATEELVRPPRRRRYMPPSSAVVTGRRSVAVSAFEDDGVVLQRDGHDESRAEP